jgi:hypothetical protein
MATRRRMTVDGNEAAASVAIAPARRSIYPITPSSPMASARGRAARGPTSGTPFGDGGDAVGGGAAGAVRRAEAGCALGDSGVAGDCC